jgi:PAS domain S-box-containing protein
MNDINKSKNQLINELIEPRQLTAKLKDIKDEHKTALKDLELFRNLINQSNDALYIVDPETGYLLDFNDTACENLGYTSKELLNMKVPDICLSITSQSIWDMKINELKEKGYLIFEGDQRRKDGNTFTVELNIKYISNKKKDYLVVVSRDITERKKADEALKKSKAALSEAQRLAKIGNWEWIADSDTLIWSDQMFHIMGVDEIEEPPSREEQRRLYHPDDVEDVFKRMESVFHNKIADNFEARLLSPDKSIKFINMHVKPNMDSTGNITGLFGIYQDITERKKDEEALQEAHDLLEKRVKERTFELFESNAALKVLLNKREQDKGEFESNILSNVKHLVMPYILKLKNNRLNSDELSYLNIIESNLKEIISPFSQKLSSHYMEFTPREIRIANLIKDGSQDKDIMEILNISLDTVKTHRKNIRRKLGIYGKRTNLRTKLLSLVE